MIIAAIIIFLVIKRRYKTQQYDLSDDSIVRKNPLYIENKTKDENHYEQ